MTDQPTPASAAAAMLGDDAVPAKTETPTPVATDAVVPGVVKPSDNHDKPATPWTVPDWAKDLSPEDLGYLEKKQMGDPKTLYKSYREAERALNDGRIALPKEDATPEEIGKFHSKLGRPDSPDKYTPPEGADPALFKEIAAEAFDAGLNQKQLDKLAARYNKAQHAQLVQLSDTWVRDINDSQAKLEKEWGPNTPQEVEYNKRAMRALGMSVAEASEYMTKGAERFLRLLNIAGHSIAEDNSANIASDTTLGFGLNANRASAELQELRSNKAFMDRVFVDKDPAAVAKYQRLIKSTSEAGQVRRTVRGKFTQETTAD